MRALAFFALSSATFLGCYLTSDLDGLSGGTSTPLPSDDSGGQDQFVPVLDGGSDAPVDAPGDGPVENFCAGALFCDQFDQNDRQLADGWSHFDQGVPTAAIVTDAFSGGHAFGLTMDAQLSNAASSQLVVSTPISQTQTIHVEMRIKVTYSTLDPFDPNAYFPILIFLGDDSNYLGSFAIVPGGINLGIQQFYSDGGSDQLISFASGSYVGQWVKLVLDETFSPTNGHVRAAVGDTVFLDRDLMTGKASPFQKLTTLTGLGASVGRTPKVDLVYDNFLIR